VPGSASQHLIDYTESDSYARVFVIGLLNTLLVTFIGVILATILGLSSAWRGCRRTG
jgi:ABC-type amino acid transport system permease subunit